MENERRAGIVEKLELDFYYGREAEQFTFYRLPKALITDERFKEMTNNAKLLYGLMLDRMSLSKKRGWLDEENKVFIKYSLNNIEEDLNISRKTSGSLLKELEAIGLIEMVQQTGVANIIYVKNFVSEECQEVHKLGDSKKQCEKETSVKSELVEKGNQCKNSTSENFTLVEKSDQCKNSTSVNIVPVEKRNQCKNGTSGAFEPVEKLHQCNFDTGTRVKTTPVPVEKLHPSNIEIENKMNNTNPISQSYQRFDGNDRMDEVEAYMALIRDNIDYDIMMQDYEWRYRDMYEELYQIICDVVCVPRQVIRIEGEDYPYSLVKSKFLKLNKSHLEYVISCMERNTTKIANIKAYLITALYNAPNTITHFYSAEVNHDMYGIG